VTRGLVSFAIGALGSVVAAALLKAAHPEGLNDGPGKTTRVAQ